MSVGDVAESLAGYLQYEIDEGRGGDIVSPDIMSRLAEPARVRPVAHAASSSGDLPGGTSGDLESIARAVAACSKCPLHETRTKTVPGQGNGQPEIMFIGEAPGADEDRQGLAFVGRAGQLLTRMIEAMGLTRDDVFIANIIKCRPPGNRNPHPDEMATCMPYLKKQIAVLKPRVIIALGSVSAKALLSVDTGITKLRGNWFAFEGIDLMPTFHPAYLLRNPSAKHEAWEDLKAVLTRLGRKPPPRKPTA